MKILVETDKYVIYIDGERLYMCSKEIFFKKYNKRI